MRIYLFALIFLSSCNASFVADDKIKYWDKISVEDFISSQKEDIYYSDLQNITITEDELMTDLEIWNSSDEEIKSLIDILFETN